MEAVGTILKVAQQIAKAAETARRNRARCRDLADRASTVGGILRDDYSSPTSSKAGGAGGDTASRRSALGRLKAALDDALRLVESCRRRSGWLSWLTSGRTAARFQEIESRITTCVVDLGIANDARLEKLLNDFTVARRRPGANTRATGSWKKETNRGNNATKKGGAKNGGGDMNRNSAQKKDAIAKNGDRSGGAAPAPPLPQQCSQCSQCYVVHAVMEEEPPPCSVIAAPPLPQQCRQCSQCYVVHTVMEEEPPPCSVM